ncbi:hypothetical protein GCM10027282_25040 [Frigoribacterium salinisoli]
MLGDPVGVLLAEGLELATGDLVEVAGLDVVGHVRDLVLRTHRLQAVGVTLFVGLPGRTTGVATRSRGAVPGTRAPPALPTVPVRRTVAALRTVPVRRTIAALRTAARRRAVTALRTVTVRRAVPALRSAARRRAVTARGALLSLAAAAVVTRGSAGVGPT